MRVLILTILLIINQLASAGDAPSLYQSSVNWDDVATRTTMLESGNIPSWDMSAITSVYDAYLNPEQSKLSSGKTEQQNNTLFLDQYWGPLANPFVKYQRPAKVFVYFGQATITASFMAPMVKNAADGNFYVFNHYSNKPQLLIDWINDLKAQRPQALPIRFSVCNGYGNLPKETCAGKGYQNEARYALGLSGSASEIMRLNAAAKSVNAHRDANQDWRAIAMSKSGMFGENRSHTGSIYGASVNWDNESQRSALLQTTTTWENYKTIKENFEKLRDIRYFNDERKNGFMRRISWLFPDDGCWTRASAVINHLFGVTNNAVNKFARPSKVFAFGNLCANTSNSPDGRVTWWYHTAPLIRDAETNQTYVLDPSIDPQKPLTMEAWVAAISSKTGACKNAGDPKVATFNVCTGFGSGPHDVCDGQAGESFAREAKEALLQPEYQNEERARQHELGRDADKVLGDQAPWL